MKKGKKLHGNKETVVKVCNWLSLPLQALGCCILYLVIEAFSRHSLASAWSYMVESPWVFLYNAFLIFTTFMVVYLFRRRAFWRIIISGFWHHQRCDSGKPRHAVYRTGLAEFK